MDAVLNAFSDVQTGGGGGQVGKEVKSEEEKEEEEEEDEGEEEDEEEEEEEEENEENEEEEEEEFESTKSTAAYYKSISSTCLMFSNSQICRPMKCRTSDAHQMSMTWIRGAGEWLL